MSVSVRKPLLGGLVSSCVLMGALLVLSAPVWAAGAPTVAEESFSSVTATEATLSAQIDPGGLSTTYKVEYGTSEPYASSAEATLPAAEGAVGVQVHLAGLQPGTVYHFRFVASNELGSTPGSETTFKTGTVPGASVLTLPDDRAYELVTPLAGNQEVYVPEGVVENEIGFRSDVFTVLPSRASADGGLVAYEGEPTGSGEGTGNQGQGSGDVWLARRTLGGWTGSDIQPANTSSGTEYQAFSSDLLTGFIRLGKQDRVPAVPAGPENCSVLDTRASGDGGYHALFTSTQTPGSCGVEHEPFFAGSSADGSRLFFQTGAALTPGSVEAPGGGSDNLYESVAGVASLVNLLPGGEPDPGATFGGPSSANPERTFNFSNAVSDDGLRAFWTDLNTGVLYVRENETRSVQVSGGEAAAQYWTASIDGHYAFYTEGGKLVRFNVDRFNGSTKPEPEALKEAREVLVSEGVSSEPAGVRGVLGVGDDGSYVYFVAGGVLAENKTAAGEKASVQTCREPNQSNEINREENVGKLNGEGCNLYVLHRGAGPRFIGLLAPKDNNLPAPANSQRAFGDWRPDLGSRTAEVTPDGKHLMFESRQRLTDYDNGGSSNAEREVEIFLYDVEGNGQTYCVSCDPSGAPPIIFGAGEGKSTLVPTSMANTFMRRWMNEGGTRVFFDTSQALVPQDTNGVQDVYEWEQDGEGTCRTGGGCVYLLSGGTSTDNSFLIDGSVSGGDVFFATREQLVPGAGNQKMEVYDAHECTAGAPCRHETSLACTGTGCQGVPPSPPIFATPSSVTFNGVGNFPPPPTGGQTAKKTIKCSRGKKLSHGKCIKPKHKKVKKAKRATRASNNRRATR
jgi:hypothetical protein